MIFFVDFKTESIVGHWSVTEHGERTRVTKLNAPHAWDRDGLFGPAGVDTNCTKMSHDR